MVLMTQEVFLVSNQALYLQLDTLGQTTLINLKVQSLMFESTIVFSLQTKYNISTKFHRQHCLLQRRKNYHLANPTRGCQRGANLPRHCQIRNIRPCHRPVIGPSTECLLSCNQKQRFSLWPWCSGMGKQKCTEPGLGRLRSFKYLPRHPPQ